MNIPTFLKISALTLLVCSTQSFANIQSLETLMKRSIASTNVTQEIEAQAPDLLKILDKDPTNDALNVLLHTIATSTIPVMVKFYANYCGPCRAMAPIIETVATEFEGKVSIIEVDTSTYRNMTTLFGFRYIPTLLFFKNGKEIERTNSLTQEQLQQKLEALV